MNRIIGCVRSSLSVPARRISVSTNLAKANAGKVDCTFFKGNKNLVLGEKLRCSRAKPKAVVLGDVKIYGRNRQYDDLGATRERSESRDSASRSKT